MQLTLLDWLIVAVCIALNIGIGFYYTARAGKSMDEFFLPGRNVAVVVRGDVNGRDHICRRYAAGGDGHGGAVRCSGELVVVELCR